MKIATIVGARPQFIKAAALNRAIIDHNTHNPGNKINEVLIHTGQHFDRAMSQVFFEELSLPTPQYNLNIHGGTHSSMTGLMLQGLEPILTAEAPDAVLVYGDTNSTLAGALVASKIPLRVIHVEAGLRSFNRNMPEETNRVIVDHISDLLFTTHKKASQRLIAEGISQEKIFEVGDLMFDNVLFYQEYAKEKSTILEDLNLDPKSYCLLTLHRQENTDDLNRLKGIAKALLDISQDHNIVFPIHPRTKKALLECGLYEAFKDKMICVEPMKYLDIITLSSQAKVILTDSGGLQKEAYFLNVPSVLLRTETEWTELLKDGRASLAVKSEDIQNGFKTALGINQSWNFDWVYGEGNAAKKIVEQLCV